MNIFQAYKEIKRSPFKLPNWKQYIGKLQYGTPYFWPRNFCATIISVRKLKKRSEEEYRKMIEQRMPYISEAYKKQIRYFNLPIAQRTKNWIINLFGHEYYIELGSPISINSSELGWKDKYNTPRFEWAPSFKIFFFKWQYCIWLSSDSSRDAYWEMFLWYLYYVDKDIEKAAKTWPWVNTETKESTWDKNLLK